MAKFEDYVNRQPGGIAEEIKDAAVQQQERQRDPGSGQFIADPASTPNVDWEQRYKELEKHNSRQAQTLGEYRKVIDNFIVNPTPNEPEEIPEPQPVTAEEFYDDPNAAVNRVVEQHPVVREAQALKEKFEQRELLEQAQDFQRKHPDFEQIGKSPEFQNWVNENPTRQDLYGRGDRYDFSAADALFSLYKAEKGLTQVTTEAEIQQAELVSSSGEMVQEPPRYSRSEYVNKLTRARQGDLEAEQWVKTHSQGYREALSRGNVRD